MTLDPIGAGKQMYDANEVAKLIIDVCMDEGKPITNLKLQKILYFLWIDRYKRTGEYLFDNRVEAWYYGPVVPDVYYRYRTFIADPIDARMKHSISERDVPTLSKSIHRYNSESIGRLIAESCTEGSPWDRVGGSASIYAEIRKDLMIDESNRC